VGLFYTLFNDLRNDENKFFNYFRMSCASFDELHGKLKDKLKRENTQFRNCIQPVEMLSITLRLVINELNIIVLLIDNTYSYINYARK